MNFLHCQNIKFVLWGGLETYSFCLKLGLGHKYFFKFYTQQRGIFTLTESVQVSYFYFVNTLIKIYSTFSSPLA